MSSDTMVVAALGRPFTLGMLYDARQDKLIPGLTLWSERTIDDNTTVNPQRSSTFEITSSDSIKDKSNMLNIEASLKVSFMSGLVEVGGSAKYLHDNKKSVNQSRVTLQYKATTNFKQLLTEVGTKELQNKDTLDRGTATHVVTGILYGASAFFVFDSEKVESSKVQEMQFSMEAVIKKIPTVEIEAKLSVHLTQKEEELVNKFSCKFHGDFLLDSNPTTFKDALVTYQKLPKLLGDTGENSVPMKVWMMPLKNYYAKAPQLVREISVGVVRKGQEILEDLIAVQMRCNDCLDDPLVSQFPALHKLLSTFLDSCLDYSIIVRQTLAKVIPKIRGGKEDEMALEKMLVEKQKSAISTQNLSRWLDSVEREISVLRAELDQMKGAKIVQTKGQLDKEVLSPEAMHALCFVFTSMESSDPFLQLISDYLDSPTTFVDKKIPMREISQRIVTKVRAKAKIFGDLVKELNKSKNVVFLITALPNKNYEGATIYHYRGGYLATENFSHMHVPPAENITNRFDLLWYKRDVRLDQSTAHNMLGLALNRSLVLAGEDQKYYNDSNRFDFFMQVLATEGVDGRCYVEAEWDGTNGSTGLGVTYKSIRRKGDRDECLMGENNKSWIFLYIGGEYNAIHNKQITYQPNTYCRRVGMFVDYKAGTVSWYTVTDDKVKHVHTYHTNFRESLYPGFSFGGKEYLYLF